MASNIALPSSFGSLSSEEIEYDGGLSGNEKLGITFAVIGGIVFLTGAAFAIRNGIMASKWTAGSKLTDGYCPNSDVLPFSHSDCLYQAAGYKNAMWTSCIIAGTGAIVGGGLSALSFLCPSEK